MSEWERKNEKKTWTTRMHYNYTSVYNIILFVDYIVWATMEYMKRNRFLCAKTKKKNLIFLLLSILLLLLLLLRSQLIINSESTVLLLLIFLWIFRYVSILNRNRMKSSSKKKGKTNEMLLLKKKMIIVKSQCGNTSEITSTKPYIHFHRNHAKKNM